MTAVFAHRGCTDGFIENTVPAFAEARRLGADGVELDVHLTADGALAVHHDAEIAGIGLIGALGRSELPPHVPLLAEVLAVCGGMVVNVEVKNDPSEGGHPDDVVAAEVARVVEEAGWIEGVLVSSFSVSAIEAVARADRRLRIGVLWPPLTDTALALPRAVQAGWQAVHPFVTEVSADLVDRAHEAGLAVNVWTVNAPHDLAAFVTLGVDVIITDRLAEAMAAARGGGG